MSLERSKHAPQAGSSKRRGAPSFRRPQVLKGIFVRIRDRNLERVDRHRDQRVIAENADELDETAAAQQTLGEIVRRLRDAALRNELASELVDRFFIVLGQARR